MSRLDFSARYKDTASISAKGNNDLATGTAAAADRSQVDLCLGTCPWCDIFPLCMPDEVGGSRFSCARQQIDQRLDHPEADPF